MNNYLILQSPRLNHSLTEQAAAIAEANQVVLIKNNAFNFHNINLEQLDELKQWAQEKKADLALLNEIKPLKKMKILAMDMDSTLINIECIDEIAAACGRKAEVAAITEATMRGEIKDFKESLIRRVAMLEGVEATVLDTIYEQTLQLNPGAINLLDTAKKAGLTTLLVSGGFTFFTERLAERLGFDYAYANQLEIKNGLLTGKVNGPIVDGQAKANYLAELKQQLNAEANECIAIGDGSNDLPMMAHVKYSVAYYAKPSVQEKANYQINFNGLDAVLNWFK